MWGDLAGAQAARDDAAGAAVVHDKVEHLRPHEHLDSPSLDLAAECLVRPKQQLLACLAARVERARHLSATERAIGQEPAVFAGKWHALRDGLVDDVHAELREPEYVRLPRPKVATLHGVVEQAVDAVAVILIVLGGVDPALRRDAMRAPRAVLVAEAFDVVAHLAERGCRCTASEAAAHHDDRVLAAVGGRDELVRFLVLLPALLDGTGRFVRSKLHDDPYSVTKPASTEIGNDTFPIVIAAEIAMARSRRYAL